MTRDEVAQAAYKAWSAKGYTQLSVIALISMQDGETSLTYPFPIGDHGKAHGPFQGQETRRQIIKEAIGIDINDPNLTIEDGVKAADWEIRESRVYHWIGPVLDVLTTLEANVAILVCCFEQSGNRPRDIQRRLNLATYWAKQFGVKA